MLNLQGCVDQWILTDASIYWPSLRRFSLYRSNAMSVIGYAMSVIGKKIHDTNCPKQWCTERVNLLYEIVVYWDAHEMFRRSR